MDKISYLTAIVVILIIILVVVSQNYICRKRTQLRENMRKMWLSEVLWLKSLIVLTVENADAKAKSAVIEKLNKNTRNIANTIKELSPGFNSSGFEIKMNTLPLLYSHLVEETLGNNLSKAKNTWSIILNTSKDIALCLKLPGLNFEKTKKHMESLHKSIGSVITSRLERNWVNNNEYMDIAIENSTLLADHISNKLI